MTSSPNGNQTSTLRTFNSMANMLVQCAHSTLACVLLFRLARPPRGPAPRGTLTAVADIARNPWHNVGGLFTLARASPRSYRPALGVRGRPDAWILALRFDGGGKSMSGPGNMAINARGDIWITNNYLHSPNPLAPVCGGKILLELTPTGQYAPGSPYRGGGLDGAGFGITFDARGHQLHVFDADLAVLDLGELQLRIDGHERGGCVPVARPNLQNPKLRTATPNLSRRPGRVRWVSAV